MINTSVCQYNCIKVLIILSLFCKNMGVTVEAGINIDLKVDQERRPFPKGLSNEECVRRIYRDCNYPKTFTDEELENVRQFLNHSFSVLADIKPDKPLCPKLHVRQDWKCLSEQQKTRVTVVWREMFRRGTVQKLTDIHRKTWPLWHKTVDFLPTHRWLSNEFEKEMRVIDRTITLPYWDPYTYGVQPERSSIWDTLGHAGNYSNGYEVPDGVYPKWGLIPKIKRHWSPRETIYPWFTQETVTSIIQNTRSYDDLLGGIVGIHFNPHICIGGYEGQYASRDAPYDPLFHLQHSAGVDVLIFRWHLLRREFLTPLSYNTILTFDPKNCAPIISNIKKDTLPGIPSVTVREMFWIGFGDLCYIPDQLVRPISNIWKGIADPIPTAAKRLPKEIIENYFPFFYSGNYSGITHTLEETGECNTVCRPIPKPTLMRETEIGRRQFQALLWDYGVDRTYGIGLIEQSLLKLWSDLNSSGYCSPYVTTYTW